MRALAAAVLVMAVCAAMSLSFSSSRPTSMLQYDNVELPYAPSRQLARSSAPELAYRREGYRYKGGERQSLDFGETFARMSALEKVAQEIEKHENLWGTNLQSHMERATRPSLRQARTIHHSTMTETEPQPRNKVIFAATKKVSAKHDKFGIPKHEVRDPSERYLKIVSPP
eukprot:760862-Hanusia_phi.AAC.4